MIFTNYLVCFFLIALGIYCMVSQKNLFKITVGMGLVDYGVNLLIVSVGFHDGGTAPIFNIAELNRSSFFVDPIPQALTHRHRRLYHRHDPVPHYHALQAVWHPAIR